jgi:hypothetical protein
LFAAVDKLADIGEKLTLGRSVPLNGAKAAHLDVS